MLFPWLGQAVGSSDKLSSCWSVCNFERRKRDLYCHLLSWALALRCSNFMRTLLFTASCVAHTQETRMKRCNAGHSAAGRTHRNSVTLSFVTTRKAVCSYTGWPVEMLLQETEIYVSLQDCKIARLIPPDNNK